MSYMSEIDLARQQGEKTIRMRIHDGRRMSICTSCMEMAPRNADQIQHRFDCQNTQKLTKSECDALRIQMRNAIAARFSKKPVRSPSLFAMAIFIRQFFGLNVNVFKSSCDTDRKAGRLRIPGKGRNGNRIQIFDKAGVILLDHNSAETYRHNTEVAEWIFNNEQKFRGK